MAFRVFQLCNALIRSGASKSLPARRRIHGENMPDHEQRLTRLEELNFFQEERLKELDAALTIQQDQLDKVEQQLADALALIRLLREKLADQPDDSLPPHFMPERY